MDRLSDDSNICVSARGRDSHGQCLMTITSVSVTEGETAMDGLSVDSNVSVSLMTATSVSVPATEGETAMDGHTV